MATHSKTRTAVQRLRRAARRRRAREMRRVRQGMAADPGDPVRSPRRKGRPREAAPSGSLYR